MFQFKGGKGILSGGTVAIMIDWRIAVVVWGGFLMLDRPDPVRVPGLSVGRGQLPLYQLVLLSPDRRSLCWPFCLGGLVVWKHRANIQRLLAGNENKLSFHRKKT